MQREANVQTERHRVRSAAVLALGLALAATPWTPASAQDDGRGSGQEAVYPAQTSEGEVTLEVQPRWEDGVLLVQISANTHSVSLSELDLAEQVRLLVGEERIAPVRAGALSGHHGQATLEFRLETRPDRFSLEIRDVPDVPVRLLTWPVESPPSPTAPAPAAG